MSQAAAAPYSGCLVPRATFGVGLEVSACWNVELLANTGFCAVVFIIRPGFLLCVWFSPVSLARPQTSRDIFAYVPVIVDS